MSPQKIRPDQDFRLFVTIYKMYHDEVDVRAVISRDAVEYATQTITFIDTGTKEMLLKVCMGVILLMFSDIYSFLCAGTLWY